MGPANYNYSYVVGKSCTLGPQGDRWWNGYEDSIFQQHVLQFIEESTPSDPLFIFWAPHIVHTPLQVPEEYFRMFDFVEATDKATHERQIYHAMVHFADAVRWRCFAAHSISLTWNVTMAGRGQRHDKAQAGGLLGRHGRRVLHRQVRESPTFMCAMLPSLTRCCDAAAARSMTTARPAQIIGP